MYIYIYIIYCIHTIQNYISMKRVSSSIHSGYKDMNMFLAITLFPAISSCCKIPFAQNALLKSD